MLIGLSASPAWAVPFEFRGDLFGGFMLRLPESIALSAGAIQGDLRSLGKADVPLAGAVGYLGTRLSIGAALGRHVVVRGFGFGFGGAVGPAPSTVSAIDGTIVEARPWGMTFWESEMIGISVRGVHRRLAFEATASAGAMGITIPVAASFGKDTVSASPSAATFLARVEGQACFRVDWTMRACLFAGVNVYQFGFLNGGLAGLRWELGK